jgi:hypothetical protein
MPVNAGGYGVPLFDVIANNSMGDSELPAATPSATPLMKSLREIFSFLDIGVRNPVNRQARFARR